MRFAKISKSIQTNLTLDALSSIFLSLKTHDELQQQLKKLTLCCKSLENDDDKTRYYTGLHTYNVFKLVIDYIHPFIKVHLNTVLPAEDQILLTLVKLRLNLDFKDLAYRFGISKFSTSTYFKNTLRIIYLRFKTLVFWPDRSIILKTVPSCFKESFHENTTIIIDCFEIRTQTPSNMLAAAQSWSNYKHSQTVKYLIGITPQGSVCFISEGWGGRVSDKFLIQNSVLLNQLVPGDVVMADRDFLIREFVELFQASVKIPAFTRGKSQLHPVDLEKTRSIAHVRIHVERVIGGIRQKYSILHDVVPILLLNTGGEQPILDEIVHVCCALFN
ncbi:hypothetical protein NQ314_003765 [Rhamnusium bicolor]|uniref:DDE Tnp4 domain-containing protein n=1 Tax=Rhamnusium bicolor TaxID=1586634 RepID=A0AAV8ZNZ0_9CUCU|nr:hypothetical protein NQ314_003765 [Rhamnusium bicolor]